MDFQLYEEDYIGKINNIFKKIKIIYIKINSN
jgi:hypothetical protein